MTAGTTDDPLLMWPEFTGTVHHVEQLLLGDACPQCGQYDACEYRLTDSKKRPGYYFVGALCRNCGGCTVGYQPDPERVTPDEWIYRE